jgi:hypothetical protein
MLRLVQEKSAYSNFWGGIDENVRSHKLSFMIVQFDLFMGIESFIQV